MALARILGMGTAENTAEKTNQEVEVSLRVAVQDL